MCAKANVQLEKPAGTKLQYYNDANVPSSSSSTSSEESIMSNVPNDIPLHGYGAFSIGTSIASGTGCFCGWKRDTEDNCLIPTNLCAAASLNNCKYPLQDKNQSRNIVERILSTWPSSDSINDAMDCPDLQLSDAWGILSSKESDAWIESGSTSSGDLPVRLSEVIRGGRAGLRIGNMYHLRNQASMNGTMKPSDRVEQLYPTDDVQSTGAALHRCSDTIFQTFDATKVVNEVIDDLFPVAQGIYESAPMSMCLRFAIEYSGLRMLKAIRNLIKTSTNSASSTILEDEIRKQKSVTDQWKGRCESQLNMLAICKSNGVFDIIPRQEIPYECPFKIKNLYYNSTSKIGTKYYVTPTGCLLYYENNFYNPCRHSQDPCSSSKKAEMSIEDIVSTSEASRTRLRFDVRSTGNGEILGTWPIQFHDLDNDKNQIAAQVVQMIMRWKSTSSSASTAEEMQAFEENDIVNVENRLNPANIPWRLSSEFIQEIFMNGGNNDQAKGSIGNTIPNTEAKGWGTAEGFATTSNAAEFCDTITDWWPDVRNLPYYFLFIKLLYVMCFMFL